MRTITWARGLTALLLWLATAAHAQGGGEVWDWEWENTDLEGRNFLAAGGQSWAYVGYSQIEYSLVRGGGRVFGISRLTPDGWAARGQLKAHTKRRDTSPCSRFEYAVLQRCSDFAESYTSAEVYIGYNIGSDRRPLLVSAGGVYSNGVSETLFDTTANFATSIYARLYSYKRTGLAMEVAGALDVWSVSLVFELGDLRGDEPSTKP